MGTKYIKAVISVKDKLCTTLLGTEGDTIISELIAMYYLLITCTSEIYSCMAIPVCKADNIILVETPLLSKTPKFTGRLYKLNLTKREWKII